MLGKYSTVELHLSPRLLKKFVNVFNELSCKCGVDQLEYGFVQPSNYRHFHQSSLSFINLLPSPSP